MKKLADLNENLRPASNYQLLINGEWRDGASKQTYEATNPATNETLATIAVADKEDVDAAVTAAWDAFDACSQVSPQERSALLVEVADVIEAEVVLFLTLLTLENGKRICDTSNIDIPLAIDHFRYFAGVILGRCDEANLIDKNSLCIVLSEPIGVVGQI